jgi:glutathione S-transferase
VITVHHLNNSRSQRVLWLLEELGLPYEVKRYERDQQTMLAPPELLAVHPLGKSPVISDGGKVIAESGLIVEYLVDTYGAGSDGVNKLAPPRGTPAWLRYGYWLHYAEGSAMPPLVLKLIFTEIPKRRMPFFIRPIVRRIAGEVQSGFVDPTITTHLKFWEAELGRSAWFAGDDFSAADIMMSFPLEAAGTRADFSAFPRIRAVLDAMHARPAYKWALDRGGPYDFAPKG